MTDMVYSLEQLKSALAPVFRRNGVNTAYVFGSYGKGLANPKSDIDIFVDSGLQGFAFYGLLDEIVQAVDKNVDLIDLTDVVHDSRIEREINSSGVLIYEK